MEPEIEQGDQVRVVWKGMEIEGTFLTKDSRVTVIKLKNGYNLSLNNLSIESMALISKHSERAGKIGGIEGKGKTVHLIGTGGTIASYVDYETGAVKPLTTAQEMLYAHPALAEIANIDADIALNIFSEDMKIGDWVEIARKIYDKIGDGEGAVITHGTDTLSYTTSAISFLIENPSAPIVFTASQRSSDRPSSDAYLNLLGAVKVAQTRLSKVAIVMHSSVGDDRLEIISGVRARKMHTSRRDAFRSINTSSLGFIDRNMEIHWNDYSEIGNETMKLYEKMDERVALIYYHPGMGEEEIHRMLENKNGAIIMGTGLGHISNALIPVIGEYVSRGMIVGMTSQCLYGTVNMQVYSTGRNLLRAGVIPLGDMLPEVAFTKLSFLLGNFDHDTARRMIAVNLRGEMSERRRE